MNSVSCVNTLLMACVQRGDLLWNPIQEEGIHVGVVVDVLEASKGFDKD
jgi:hypothetical protein